MEFSQIKCISFDYYGTLVDVGNPFQTIKQWFKTHHCFERQNINVDRFNWLFTKHRAVLACGNDFKLGIQILTESYIFACKKFHIESNIKEFTEMVSSIFKEATAYKNALETVNFLKEHYQVGLITNADNIYLQNSIKKNGFDFDFIISSEDARCNKPDDGIFKTAIEVVKIPTHQILMVGDSIVNDIQPARKLGIHAIWLNRGIEKHKSFKSISNFEDLMNLIKTKF